VTVASFRFSGDGSDVAYRIECRVAPRPHAASDEQQSGGSNAMRALARVLGRAAASEFVSLSKGKK
jgi:hypothetical protein